ncbi:unnamed protein product [Pieris macdunnoughi]|uniref:Ig-like domain-containing protein n=1 Tax=Pieris macdunnoughi TaxID=345717 RepID=A0A821XQH5_9NEOP|nr:unnamed protein product [Pieris macdunnoughi]
MFTVCWTLITSGRMSENVLSFKADASDNKARYTCEAKNIMISNTLKAEIDLTVLFAPAHVTISGPTEARVGDPVPLTCTTAPSNPAPEIKWLVLGKNHKEASNRTVISPEGGWITTSNITAVVEPNRRSVTVVCHGINTQLTEITVASHTINVLYEPIFDETTQTTAVGVEHEQLIVSARAHGNPSHITYTWTKDGLPITHSSYSTTTSSEVGELNVVSTEFVETADVSKSVVVYVSITGVVLVLINAALVACFIFKRRSRRLKGKQNYVPAPSPMPPLDGSYYNMSSDRYLSYPPLIGEYLQQQQSGRTPTPPQQYAHKPLSNGGVPSPSHLATPPLNCIDALDRQSTGGTLRRQRFDKMAVPPPDVTVLHPGNCTQHIQLNQTPSVKQPQSILKDPSRHKYGYGSPISSSTPQNSNQILTVQNLTSDVPQYGTIKKEKKQNVTIDESYNKRSETHVV